MTEDTRRPERRPRFAGITQAMVDAVCGEMGIIPGGGLTPEQLPEYLKRLRAKVGTPPPEPGDG